MLRTILLLALCFGCVPSQSSAQDVDSGNYWLQRCAPGRDSKGQIDCTALLYGVNQYNRLIGEVFDLHVYCLPTGVSHGQTQQVVVKYLQENPALLHREFIDLAIVALRQAFPCPKKDK